MEKFKITKVKNNIFKIEEMLYKEHANLYLFISDNFYLLVDSGTGFWNLKEKIYKTFGNNTILLINTHGHYDHIGGNKQFSFSAIHENDLKSLTNPTKENTVSFKFSKSDMLTNNNESIKSLKSAPNMILHGGEKIAVGKFIFKILHTPGHSPGSISLYDEKNKTLVSGDMLYNGKLYYNLPKSDKFQYIESLKSTKKMKVQTLLAGHNEIILGEENIQKLMNKAIFELEEH
ncbi:MAG: MBL fold metallo-hydrolase [Candidatus Aenigmarchaeota archaeon]|nr:MBL fold metallo-hydrolase [Candidatus Aenigmarchaeota archaeon]